MDPMNRLVLATVAFLATHFIASMPLRGWLVARTGQRFYIAIYSALAFVTLWWMASTYRHAPFEPLWTGVRYVPLLLMPLALILLVGGLGGRNPTAIGQEAAFRSAEPARGIVRVTRHPVMWAIALWAIAHVAARGDVKSLIFFGGLLLLALLGPFLIDRRKTALGENWRRFAAVTSNVPFLAIVQGRNRLSVREVGYPRLAIAGVLYIALVLLHPYIFGARPY